MSLCVRSLTSSNKYVSPFFVTMQACNMRGFGSRQLLKHVEFNVASTFFIEGSSSHASSNSSVPVRKTTNLSKIGNLSDNVYLKCSYIQNNFLFNYYDNKVTISKNSNKNSVQHIFEHNKNICYMIPTKTQKVFPNSLLKYKSQTSIYNQEDTFVNVNHRKNFTNPDTHTKNVMKVNNFIVPRNAITIRQQTTNASLVVEKSAKKQPSASNLDYVYNILCVDLPTFFSKSIDYKIYHNEIEFVNNLRGSVTKGITQYIKQLAFLRIIGHLKFAYVKFDILKITKHPEDSTIRVRWRINGITGMNILFSVWKFKIFKLQKTLQQSETWYDGYSTFYIGEDGLIYKHIADKMIPDNNEDDKSKSRITSELSFSNCELKYLLNYLDSSNNNSSKI